MRLEGDYLAIVTLAFGEIIRVFFAAQKGNLRAVLLCDRCDFLILRRDHDRIEQTAGTRGLKRPGYHGLAAELPDVFARNAFRTAARGDDGNAAHEAASSISISPASLCNKNATRLPPNAGAGFAVSVKT